MEISNLHIFLNSLSYESKDWKESDIFGKVQWLDCMYKNKKEEIESLHSRIFELQKTIELKDQEIEYLRSCM